MNRIFIIISLFLLASCTGDRGPEPDFSSIGNHHLHNFRVTGETAWHAVAMGYSMICHEKPEGPEFEELGLIETHNARTGPIRIYVDKQTGEIMIRYHDRYTMPHSDMNAIAHQYGLDRKAGELYPLTEEDWEIIRSYNAMVKDASSIPATEVTESTFEEYFAQTWPLENEQYRSFNLGGNWQSKKVVHDFLRHLKAQYEWTRLDALFFDGINNIDVDDPVNYGFGGMGHYDTPREGQHDFMSRMADYLRNPDSTGNENPLLVVGNIWSPKSGGGHTVVRAFSDNKLQLDHYYYEKGGVGEQHPNGVVPGTDQPAYVVPGEPGHFLPASRVALDDKYAYNNAVHKGAVDYEREQHFIQHLDACGTAGLYGAWFGWYGEDYVTLKDEAGRLIYTNDLQLLRAIPNWDNLWGVPVPSFHGKEESDVRSWSNQVYESSMSFASEEVIHSVSPFNRELYVVFRDRGAEVDLKGKKIKEAWWVDDWFRKTDQSAMDALRVSGERMELDPQLAEEAVMRGIRVVFQ